MIKHKSNAFNSCLLYIWDLWFPKEIDPYFQCINTDDEYLTPEPLGIPEGSKVPALDECSVRKYLTQLKQTSPGLGFPYWFWHDYVDHLSPVIKRIFNCSLKVALYSFFGARSMGTDGASTRVCKRKEKNKNKDGGETFIVFHVQRSSFKLHVLSILTVSLTAW